MRIQLEKFLSNSRRNFIKSAGLGSMGLILASQMGRSGDQKFHSFAGEAKSSLHAVGNTPLIKLNTFSEAKSAEIWVKWEGANPTGSMKDRMALGIIESAEKKGLLKPGMRIIELTGGSTGSSLAMVAGPKGYKTHFVTSDAVSLEKRLTMEALGATLELIPSHGQGITPELVQRSLEKVRELAHESDTFWVNQFSNPDNAAGYRILGQEILNAGMPDAFVMGVGTGGCITGVSEVLKDEKNGNTPLIVAVEPAASRSLSGGPTGGHQLEGIGLGFIPETLRMDLIDEIEAVSDDEAFEVARSLARKEGLFAGPTSGANVAVAQRIAKKLGPGKRVVTLLCDTGLRYLSTDLYGS